MGLGHQGPAKVGLPDGVDSEDMPEHRPWRCSRKNKLKFWPKRLRRLMSLRWQRLDKAYA